jgi:septum formation protein
VEFTVRPSDVDETQRPGEGAHAYVERLAREKSARGEGLVLAADTSVVIDDEVLGKPGADRALGASMLRRLSGRDHEVLTGVALTNAGRTVSRVVSSKVVFRALSDAEIAWYVATGEGADKAGGYALQGRASVFITAVVGSPSNVIGLPLTETIELLRAAGVPLPMDR